MIERHHATKPVRIFEYEDGWDYYRYVKSYRDCWIWHIVVNAGCLHPSGVTYAVQCPDGTHYFAKNMKEAQIIAGRWSNGMGPKIPEEAEVL